MADQAAVSDSWQETWGSALEARVSFVLAEVEQASEAEAILQYELSHRHPGLVIWSSGGRVLGPKLRSVVAGLGVAHGVIDTLVVPRDISTLYVRLSLSGSASQAVAAIDRRTAALRDVRAAVGEPLAGLPGFKATHGQALLARSMAHLPGSRRWRAVHYRDVAASSMVIRHPEDVEPWVAGFWASSAIPVRMPSGCGTRSGCTWNPVRMRLGPPAGLYVHRNTVKYRVARALELLAVPLEQHRLSVALALNYHHVAIGPEQCGLDGTPVPDRPAPDG